MAILILVGISFIAAIWMIVDNHRLSNELHRREMAVTAEQLYYQIISPHRIRPIIDEEGFIIYE
jgi:hypothetical protein